MEYAVNETIRARLRVLTIVCAALMASVIIYGAIPFLVTPADPDQEPQAVLLPVLGFVSLMMLPITLVARKVLLGAIALLGPDELAVSRADPMDREMAADQLTGKLARYFNGTIVSMALAESIAIYGLVLAFVGFPPVTAIPFCLLALAAQAIFFPRASALLGLLDPAALAALRAAERG